MNEYILLFLIIKLDFRIETNFFNKVQIKNLTKQKKNWMTSVDSVPKTGVESRWKLFNAIYGPARCLTATYITFLWEFKKKWLELIKAMMLQVYRRCRWPWTELRLPSQHGRTRLWEVQGLPLRPAVGTFYRQRGQRVQRSASACSSSSSSSSYGHSKQHEPWLTKQLTISCWLMQLLSASHWVTSNTFYYFSSMKWC